MLSDSPTTSTDAPSFEEQLENKKHELDNIEYRPLSRSGPVCSNLDKVLDTHAITPQAYHCRSLIGNHCHTYLKQEVYENITSSIVETTRTWTQNPFILDKAEELKHTFDSLNKDYELVHKDLSHTSQIDQSCIATIKTNIDKYMDNYRLHFSNKVIPKQHILEQHCLPFIENHRLGLGLLGEQGGAVIHASISKLERRTMAIRNEKRRLKMIMECHLLQVSPSLQSHVPPTKKRKRDSI